MRRVFLLTLLLALLLFAQGESGFLGVVTENLGDELRTALALEHGVIVTKTVEGSAAEKAGIAVGDIIIEIDGEKITDTATLGIVVSERPRKEVAISLVREAEPIILTAQIGVRKRVVQKPGKMFMLSVSGGPMPLWFMTDLEPINREVGTTGLDSLKQPLLRKGIFLMGGGGTISLGRHMRIGGMAGGGELSTSGKIPVTDDTLTRQIDFRIGYGGFITEFVLSLRRFNLFAGALLGGGYSEIRLFQSSGSPDWDGVWQFDPEHQTIELSAPFFAWEPYAGIEYFFYGWLGIRTEIGFLGARIGKGAFRLHSVDDTELKLFDSPEMDFSDLVLHIGPRFRF